MNKIELLHKILVYLNTKGLHKLRRGWTTIRYSVANWVFEFPTLLYRAYHRKMAEFWIEHSHEENIDFGEYHHEGGDYAIGKTLSWQKYLYHHARGK